MVFNSIFFIFCFLPVFMLIYYLVPGKLRNLLLFLGSLIFYAWGEPVYVTLILFSSVVDYIAGRMVGYYKQLGSIKGQKIAVQYLSTVHGRPKI